MKGQQLQNGVLAAISDFLTDPEQWNSSLSGSAAVHNLERKFAKLVGHPYAVAVPNATLGLWAAFLALEIEGGETITTPFTWAGALAPLPHARSRPIFADIISNSLVLDPKEVQRRLNRHTKAILSVDIFGHPSVGEELRRLAVMNDVRIIQDCAESFGAFVGKHHTGFWSDVAIFSLGFSKALFAGEGGVLVMRDRATYERAVWLTQHPFRQMRDVPRLPRNEMALNLRLNPLAAVWATAKFDDVLRQTDRRRESCVRLLNLLCREKLSRTLPPNLEEVRPSFHAVTFNPTCHTAKIRATLSKVVSPFWWKSYKASAAVSDFIIRPSCSVRCCRSGV